MLIADGGGGYGGTDWNSKDVRYMWAMVANQETDTHFDVVEGWRKTADLTSTHIGQVTQYRDNLASVWPPSKSAASAAYIERLNKLIADLQTTHDAASANYTAFSTVTLTLSLARTKLKPILEQFEANQQLNLDWQAKKDATPAPTPKATGTPSPTPSPSPSPSPIAPVPPVSAAQQERLNNQARVIMYDLSSTVISGQAALQKPKAYDPSDLTGHTEDGSKKGNGEGTGFPVPPVIPAPGSGSGAVSASHTSTGTAQASVPVPPATTPIGSPPGGVIGGGPVLGGLGPTPVANPPTSTLPPTPSPLPTPGPNPPALTPGLITPAGGLGTQPPSGLFPGGKQIPAVGLIKPGMGGGPGGRIAMPSGGVIGATPGSGLIGQMPGGSPGQSRPGAAGRVNPVGGVIGQQGSGQQGARGGAGRAGSAGHYGQMAGQPGRARGRREGEGDQNRWDPDNPWVTEEGVDPVVSPPEDPGPIDPGPAIGYPR
ncbi:hypothetical protein [Actinoplanes sp. NPDC026623]|uniref:hypothetical protein n=1 Tax=Actinoplanes sp. NPDC026623 TaxID=3155610 RepID=UPI0033EB06E0